MAEVPWSTHVATTQQQHVEFYRKWLLRKHLLRWARPGAVYVPFIGDGDLALELYDDRQIYGADLDATRVLKARSRLAHAQIKVADCDVWTFPGLTDTIAVCDFDSYVEPYRSFKAFWRHHEAKADRMVMFFTDGLREGILRTGSWRKPDGTKVRIPDNHDKNVVFNAYWSRHVLPWFEAHIEPWRLVDKFRYSRRRMMYWGAVVERPKEEKC